MGGCHAGLSADVPPDPIPAIPIHAAAPQDPDPTPVTAPDAQPNSTPITIVAVGDIMPGSMTPIPFVPAPTDLFIPEEIRRLVSEADVVFGNLEGTFIVEGMAPSKCRAESREAGRCYEFGFPPFLASFLKDAGFTVLSLDNNHAEDYGLAGYVFTQGLLAQTGVIAVPKRTPVTFSVRDAAVVVVPFGFSGRSFHVSDLEATRSAVEEAASRADLVIVSFHGGAEGEHASKVIDSPEEYFGEDRGNVVRFAHTAIDAGADLVLGHGPHVPRAVELYQGRLIAYSLGNFWTYGNVSIKGVNGVTPLLRVALTPDGTFVSGRLVPLRQRLPGIPEPDPHNQAVHLMADLTREDFPSGSLTISEAGELRTIFQYKQKEGQRTETCDEDPSSECSEAGLLPPD